MAHLARVGKSGVFRPILRTWMDAIALIDGYPADMLMDMGLVGASLVGALLGAVIALLPGLHAYTLASMLLVLLPATANGTPSETTVLFLLGVVVGWVMLNMIPAIFLYAPDDANAGAVLPATKYMLRGRGAEATLLVGAGSLGALLGLVLLAPLLDQAFRPLRSILQPHTGWMLVAIIAFMLLGEWPRSNMLTTPIRRLLSAWAYLGSGLLAFVLSGALGFVLMYRNPLGIMQANQALAPAFMGLFVLPGALQMLAFSRKPPRQHAATFDVAASIVLRGTLTGLAGGLFAGFLPVVSGGIGGLLAGHASSKYDDRLFLISQGASKVAYYVSSLMLFFVPGLTMVRGGMAGMLSTTYIPYGWRMYALAVASIALAGALSFGLLLVFTHLAVLSANKMQPRWIAFVTIMIALGITGAWFGGPGLIIAAVGTCIGLLPVLVGGRRMNCLGVLLLPITLNVIGIGPDVARWLGLL